MRFLHTGRNQPDKTAVCLESLQVFGEGRTFPDLPPERQAEGKSSMLSAATMQQNPAFVF